MKRWFYLLIFSVLIFGGNNDVFATTVFYDVTNISGNLWEYEYEVVNNTLLADIDEFTIWFEYGLYDGLNVTTPVADWDEIVSQPDIILPVLDDGFYDAYALVSGIAPATSKSGFSVSFNWLGLGTPDSQFFEIVDTNSFNMLDSGYTTPFPSAAPIPEPATMFLLAPGLVLLGIMKKSYK
jgi:hypothetical protein